MTAEAEKIMTSPMKTRRVVTVNIQRSTLTRLAMKPLFHHADGMAGRVLRGEFGLGDDFVGSRWAGGQRGAAAWRWFNTEAHEDRTTSRVGLVTRALRPAS